MQFVQFFQVKDCRYLQEIEIIFAGITKIGDVAKEGGTPLIVLAGTAVDQQVVPPSVIDIEPEAVEVTDDD
jgi:hypothetical protein